METTPNKMSAFVGILVYKLPATHTVLGLLLLVDFPNLLGKYPKKVERKFHCNELACCREK